MTVKQQIKAYRELRKNGQAFFVDNYEDADNIIFSLEKQMPKKPKLVEADMDGMDMETGEEYTYKVEEAHCNHCDCLLGVDFDRYERHFCPNCGQKIDWSVWVKES